MIRTYETIVDERKVLQDSDFYDERMWLQNFDKKASDMVYLNFLFQKQFYFLPLAFNISAFNPSR